MNDMPPTERLAKLRALEEWLAWQLNDTRRKIRAVEAEAERDRRRRERAFAEQRWKLEPSRNGDRRVILHRGGCSLWKKERGFLERGEVLLALEDELLELEMCGVCRPETGLDGAAGSGLPYGGGEG